MLVYDQYLYHEKPNLDDDIVIFHSGFSSTYPNYTNGKDTRDYFLLHYVTKGKGVYETNQNTYHLSTYDGFLILPNNTIIHTADRYDPWHLCWVAFFGKGVEKLLKSAGLDANNLIFHYENDDFLEKCIKEIYNISRTTLNIAQIKGYFYLLMGKLIEQHEATMYIDQECMHLSHFDSAIIYINKNIRTLISIDDLANHLRLDTSQVYRVFKNHTNQSPYQYITNLRIKKACSLLAKTDLSIREVSEWMGYEYQSHFTKQFKRYMNMNPTEYRLGISIGSI